MEEGIQKDCRQKSSIFNRYPPYSFQASINVTLSLISTALLRTPWCCETHTRTQSSFGIWVLLLGVQLRVYLQLHRYVCLNRESEMHSILTL